MSFKPHVSLVLQNLTATPVTLTPVSMVTVLTSFWTIAVNVTMATSAKIALVSSFRSIA